MKQALKKEWTVDVKPGIYDGVWKLRLYEHKALVTSPYVKWIGNTGGYAEKHLRIEDAAILAKLHKIAGEELEDSADYTERIYNIATNFELAEMR